MTRAFATLVAVLVAGSAAWAGELTTATKDQPAPKDASTQFEAPGAKEVAGKVKSLDATGRSLTLEDGTKLTIPHSLKAALGVLEKGATVKATYTEKGGQKVVTSLEVRPVEKKTGS